jgi:signal transduction histidine kinase
MSPFQRHRWFAAAAAITLAFAGVSLLSHSSFALTVFSDLIGLALMLGATWITLSNAWRRSGPERSFWVLLTLGYALWASNQISWCYYEFFLRREIPDPYFFDIILFFHAVPLIAAVGWRPDILKREGRIHVSLLSFLMLLGWWLFLYAFIVFPYQYVILDVAAYNVYYDALFLVEHILLLLALALSATTSSGGWRRLYLHLFGAGVVYTIGSQIMNRAIVTHKYYSGSAYDIAFIGPLAWMAATVLAARDWDLQPVEFNLDHRWKKVVPRLAMLAILSLPVLGLWTVFLDTAPPTYRAFRVFAILAAMLVLGTFVFLRQYIQDQTLMSLLRESRRAYESQKQLQDQLVQKEKLASLGNLVAGAAHEIDHPLGAIMTYSEQLSSKEHLNDEQNALVRKIVSQAQRTRDLVSNLLSFAQQTSGEKTPVDVTALLSRAVHMLESRRLPGKILVRVAIEENSPQVLGNTNQLFQAFVEIIENAMEALDEVGGGSLEISAKRDGADLLLQFSDSGPGLRDPQRVFDPFYTTKPIGKGTGLGLSAVYGVIQDHGGQISCLNKPEGGALFRMRLPVSAKPAVRVAGAAV